MIGALKELTRKVVTILDGKPYLARVSGYPVDPKSIPRVDAVQRGKSLVRN